MLQILGYMFGVYAITRLAMEAVDSKEQGMKMLAIFGICCMLAGMVWLTMQGAKMDNPLGIT